MDKPAYTLVLLGINIYFYFSIASLAETWEDAAVGNFLRTMVSLTTV